MSIKSPVFEKLDSLRTLGDFHAYFEAIPEKDWTTGAFARYVPSLLGAKPCPAVVACCGMGHLGFRGNGADAPGADEAMERLTALLYARWCADASKSIAVPSINDGRDERFQQSTPKARMLAACSPEQK